MQKIADLQGRKLAATSLGDFTGYQAAMGEIFKRNYDPEKFFSAVTFVGSSSKLAMQHVVQEVIDGRADAGVVRTCFLEDLTTHKGVLLPLKSWNLIPTRNLPAAGQLSFIRIGPSHLSLR